MSPKSASRLSFKKKDEKEIEKHSDNVNSVMIGATIFECAILLVFAIWRDVIPPGILSYFFSLTTGAILIWMTKACVDKEASRYTLFLVVNASNGIAFMWGVLGCWFCPKIFWGELLICEDEATGVTTFGKWQCLVGNGGMLCLSTFLLVVMIYVAARVFLRHYDDLC